MNANLGRRVAAEFIGTTFLLIAVVGSGIAAQSLSPTDVGLALLENAIATGAALVAIILALGSVSGAHLNPIVSCVDAFFGGLRRGDLGWYVLAQIGGGIVGVVLANLMFGLSAVNVSSHARNGMGFWLGEVVATFGLLLVVFGLVRSRNTQVAPFAVGAYITGAYFFTSSTSFANPAVTLARMLSDTFAGIAPSSVPGFVLAQALGALFACGAIRVLWPEVDAVAGDVVVPHQAVDGRRAAASR
jgi:glycerol uptake facilitator-like aquaporin